MAKIFQLELFIKEMSIWKLPDKSEQCDETCVEVTVFDKNVSINGYVFGKNTTMNRGQSFLFTLSAIPTDANKVFFNVFKKAYNREKNFVGTGQIPIDTIFADIFSQTFNDTATVTANRSAFNKTVSNTSAANTSSTNKSSANTSIANTSAASKNVSNKAAANTTAANTAPANTTVANTAPANTAPANTTTANATAANVTATNAIASNTAITNKNDSKNVQQQNTLSARSSDGIGNTIDASQKANVVNSTSILKQKFLIKII